MGIRNVIYILVPAVLLFTVNSCTKDENSTVGRSYLDGITGTYSGEITSDHNQNTVPGTAVVSRTEDDDLMIHCFGDILDTTIFMEAFLHGDSVMVCNTGNEFYQEYNHMGNGYHMTDMHMGETEWMHHLNDDHQPGDKHYGGFDMDHHAFSYSFQMNEEDTSYFMTFQGTKNQ